VAQASLAFRAGGLSIADVHGVGGSGAGPEAGNGRLQVAVAKAVVDNRSNVEVAAFHGLGSATVQIAVDALTDVVLAEPEPTPVPGIDETHRGKPCGGDGNGKRCTTSTT
jgi:hypothetical protein